MISCIANKKNNYFYGSMASIARKVTRKLPSPRRLEIAQDQRAVDPGESMGTLGFLGFK